MSNIGGYTEGTAIMREVSSPLQSALKPSRRLIFFIPSNVELKLSQLAACWDLFGRHEGEHPSWPLKTGLQVQKHSYSTIHITSKPFHVL